MGLSKSGSGIVMELDGSAKPFVKNSTPNNSPVDGLTKVDLTVEHTYQLVVTLATANTGNVKVYVDAAAAPVLDLTLTGAGGATATNSAALPVTYASVFRQQGTVGDTFVLFGDGSGSNGYQSIVDWVVWTAGAYTPAQLLGKLPAGLGTTTGY